MAKQTKAYRELRTQAEAADALGISPQAVGQLMRQEGAPVQMHAGKLHCQWPAFPRWREQKGGTAKIDESRARREAALAEQEELKLAKMRDELCTVEDYRAALTLVTGRLQARIGAFPARVTPLLMAKIPDGQTAILELLEEECEYLKDELRKPVDDDGD